MRLAVLSDIHGNLPALEAVLRDVELSGVDQIIVLGDLADRGPFPLETIRLIAGTGCTVIRGNTDAHLLRLSSGQVPDAWFSALQFAPIRWTLSHLTRDALDFIAGLPKWYEINGQDGQKLLFVHGSPDSDSEGIYPRLLRNRFREIVGELSHELLFCGHTHRPWVECIADQCGVNPGAVGQPFNDSRDAHYALAEWSEEDYRWHIEHRQVAYDVEAVSRAFVTSGFVSEGGPLVRASQLSIQSGSDAIMPFLRFAHYLAQSPNDHLAIVPDAILLEAEAKWHWQAGFDVTT